ncbi:MAG TPA: methyltransferase domain-containing protein [Actinocrinis sp.]|nr:methyltransferase domain-containing protein [Actinocrinis sp.]
MNRVRGLSGVNSYARELGFEPFEWLVGRGRGLGVDGGVGWLDVCCGAGLALLEAERRFVEEAPEVDVALVGVDLVDYFGASARSGRLSLVAQSAGEFRAERDFDLVTCVHGLHYVGDKLGLIGRLVALLGVDGLFVADFDVELVWEVGGRSAARRVLGALRRAGVEYDRRRHRISCTGARVLEFGGRYLGADDAVGAGYTGQAAVRSYYEWLGA